MSHRILLVDDDAAVHEVARAYLEREGYVVYSATDGRDAIELNAMRTPSLVVLDLVLPDMSGEDVLGEIRRRSQVPVLMLSGNAGTDERVHGLAMGADDYLTKPFSPRELVARIKALLRRAGDEVPDAELLSFDGGTLVIDVARHEVRLNDEPRDVTPSEFNLLLGLAQHPGRVYTRAELAYRARGHDFEGYDRTVDAHVKNLRHKIEADPVRPRYVETVRGVGYRLGVDPS
jgi:DNA-binding response OmpR family regulator